MLVRSIVSWGWVMKFEITGVGGVYFMAVWSTSWVHKVSRCLTESSIDDGWFRFDEVVDKRCVLCLLWVAAVRQGDWWLSGGSSIVR